MEQSCSNCTCFNPDATGDGFCNNDRQVYDYVEPTEWCIHHELKETTEKDE